MSTFPAVVPRHGDVWGDLGDCVPKVAPARDVAIRGSCERLSLDRRPELLICHANGESALVGAARRGATEAVRALLGAGAAVNVASASGEKALDTATANGQLGVALALVRAGAEVSRIDDGLLRVATLRGDDELVSLILRAGAPPLLPRPMSNEPPLLTDEEEPGATSCLLLAARHPMTSILDAYLNFFASADAGHTSLEAPHGIRRITALMVAAANGARDDARAAKALLAAGCSPFVADVVGRSALHRAAAADSRSVIAALTTAAKSRVGPAAYRTFVNTCEASGSGRAALHCAAVAGADTAIAALLAAGADATILDAHGASPLASAVTFGHTTSARKLLVMTDAVFDGDIDACVFLAQQGNWPVESCVELLTNRDDAGSSDEGAIADTMQKTFTHKGSTPLEVAARRGDIEAVRALVEDAGADATLSGDLSPLAAGAEANCVTICGELVKRGAQPAAALTDCGVSLLRAACSTGDTSVVQRLLGAFNSEDLDHNDLRSALHTAASRADDDAVEALLAFGHLHKKSSIFFETAEKLATTLDNRSTCDYLVRFPKAGNAREPALLAACRAGATTCVTTLTRDSGSLRSALDDDGRCALHHVAACDRALLVERLCGTDTTLISCRDALGATSLHSAAAAGAGAAIGALLRHGADVTLEDVQKRTPRDVALEQGQERAAAQLDAMADAIDDGDFEECARLADAGNWPVDWCSASGNTALVAAARRGAPDAVSRLLKSGAAVDAAASGNETPLSAAATAGHLDVCAALLAAGAKPTKVADQSASLLIAAVVSDEPELVDALLARSASARPAKHTKEPTGAFLVAVELGSAQIVDSFVQRAIKTGALDVDEPHGDIKIRTLHAAAARGRADIVQSLLGAGAQVDVLDAEGRSALHYAAGHDHDDVLRVLVSKGADVLRTDAKGNKPLVTAMNRGAKSAESALLMAESMLHPKT